MSCSSIHSFPGMCSYPAMPLIGPSINVQVLPFNCLCWFWILHWLFWKRIRHQCIPFFFLSAINAVTINFTAILLLSHTTILCKMKTKKNAKRTPSLLINTLLLFHCLCKFFVSMMMQLLNATAKAFIAHFQLETRWSYLQASPHPIAMPPQINLLASPSPSLFILFMFSLLWLPSGVFL